jgi:hypothetical protein
MPLDIDIIGPTELIPSVRTAITGLTTTYTKGQRVRLSDGTPEPPARFKRKHANWLFHNREGFIHADEGSHVTFDPNGKGCVVYRMPKSMITTLS